MCSSKEVITLLKRWWAAILSKPMAAASASCPMWMVSRPRKSLAVLSSAIVRDLGKFFYVCGGHRHRLWSWRSGGGLRAAGKKALSFTFGRRPRPRGRLYELLHENTAPSVGRLPEKLVYGSRFPFEWKDSEVKVVQEGAEIVLSHAMGGLSNAWGQMSYPSYRGISPTGHCHSLSWRKDIGP